MMKEYLEYYCCPSCRGSLNLNKTKISEMENQRIQDGILECTGCGLKFSIVNYIPRFVEENNYCQSFGFQWNRHRRIQIDKYNGYNFSRDRLFSVTGWPKKLKGEYVLEVGSGAGRFTQILLETDANIFTCDYSAAVDANLDNNKELLNYNLFQADMHNLPLCYGMFDKVICLGVLQHTPDPEKAFLALLPFLKEGGEIVIDIYKKTFVSMLQWKYILRPLLKRIKQEKLYEGVRNMVSLMLPMAIVFRKIAGRIGWRLLPITNYSNLDIPYKMNKELSILDTFDMYSPQYDRPQSLNRIKSWFRTVGLSKVDVRYGPNGIVGKGIKT